MDRGLLERARKNDAILLGLVLAGVIVHEYLGWRAAGYVAAPSLIAYIALEWPRLRANARILLFVCAGLGLVAALRSGARPVVDPQPFRYERMVDGTDFGQPGMI